MALAAIGSVVLTLLSGAAQAYGMARNSELNQQQFEETAQAEELATEFNVREFEKASSAVIGRARALRGASGVQFTGSPLLVDEATVRQAAIGAENIREQGRAKARALRRSGVASGQAGKIETASSLLNTVSQTAFGASQLFN